MVRRAMSDQWTQVPFCDLRHLPLTLRKARWTMWRSRTNACQCSTRGLSLLSLLAEGDFGAKSNLEVDDMNSPYWFCLPRFDLQFTSIYNVMWLYIVILSISLDYRYIMYIYIIYLSLFIHVPLALCLDSKILLQDLPQWAQVAFKGTEKCGNLKSSAFLDLWKNMNIGHWWMFNRCMYMMNIYVLYMFDTCLCVFFV